MKSTWGKFGIWSVITVAAVIAIAYLGSYIALRLAIIELNQQGQRITADEVGSESVSENAKSLARITQGDLLLRLKTSDLAEILEGALKLASARTEFPYAVDDVRISTGQQLLEFSGRVEGTHAASKICLVGRVHGVVSLQFEGKDLVFRPAAHRIKLERIEVPGWHWLPGSIVRLANPVVSVLIEDINRAVPEKRQSFLPEGSPARSVRLGAREIQIPALVPKEPAALIDAAGVHVLAQIVGEQVADAPKADFPSFQAEFVSKARYAFPDYDHVSAGLHLADSLIERVLGSLRAPGAIDEMARAAIAANARILNEMRGPDVVLRLPAPAVDRLLSAALARAVGEIKSDSFTLKSPHHKLRAGMIEVTATLEANIPWGDGTMSVTRWALTVAVSPSGDMEEGAVVLTPRVAELRLEDITISGRPMDVSGLIATINTFVEATRESINKALPRIPIDLPIVSPEEVELKPLTAAGIQVRFTPEKFIPLPYRVDRAIVFVSTNGIWLLGDVSVPSIPVRTPVGISIPQPLEASADEVDRAIEELVRRRHGELPDDGPFGFASWRRFAEFFNESWEALQLRLAINFDTGMQQVPTQRINLVDYARFECVRTRQCSRNPCQQKPCSFNGCSRRSCGSCPEVELKSCAFGKCVVWYRGPDQTCEAGRGLCNIAAETELGVCNVAANAAKAKCDAEAVADKMGCDIREEAALLDCNIIAEKQAVECQAKKLLTNAVAEISGVGAIGGDARIQGDLTIDARQLVFNPETPEVAFVPIISGSIRGNLGIEWTPYDVLGHVFVCPLRGKVFAESTVSFNGSRPTVLATLLLPGQAPDDGDPKTVDLGVKIQAFRIPVAVEPGLLNSLYRTNPQIAVTCPVATELLVPGLLVGSSYRAISEQDLAKAVAAASITSTGTFETAAILYASQDGNVQAGMGILFGGQFYVPVNESVQPVSLSERRIKFPGGELVVRPAIDQRTFRLESSIQ